MTLLERIDELLAKNGRMSFGALADALYPTREAHRHAIHGGPPGCYITLSMWIRRGGYPESWKEPGSYNRFIFPRRT